MLGESDFYDRKRDLAREFLGQDAQSRVLAEGVMSIIKELADKYRIVIDEKDRGEQEIPAHMRSWRRYQVWFNDPDDIDSGVYGESDISLKEAYNAIPFILAITANG